MPDLKELFLLDPKITFLNHGSFGATPRPVFEAYQSWQRKLERQPVEFLLRREPLLMDQARKELAKFVNCDHNDLVYFPNTTTALNVVIQNLPLSPGDEVLISDQEYGAMVRTWNFVTQKHDAKLVKQTITLPLTDPTSFVADFWSAVTEHTRVIFISHITSETALILPIRELISRARQAGIFTIIDGAHAIGQIPLDLSALDPDFYASNCHKWLCAPKGSAFLYARKQLQAMLDPLVVSWGYQADFPRTTQFIDYHEWQGTRDISAYLSVPAAIQFQHEHNWESIRMECHELAVETRDRIIKLTGLPSIAPPDSFAQMFSCLLPAINVDKLKLDLWEKYQIEAPILVSNKQTLIRVSIQAYNDNEDTDKLLNALKILLPQNTL